jgi:hypothetical protein
MIGQPGGLVIPAWSSSSAGGPGSAAPVKAYSGFRWSGSATVGAIAVGERIAVRAFTGGLTWLAPDPHGTDTRTPATGAIAVRRTDPFENPPRDPAHRLARQPRLRRRRLDPTGPTHLGACEYRYRAIIRGAVDPANLRSTITLKDGSSLAKYVQNLSNGTQAWAEVRNGTEITNGGLNVMPR